MQLRLNAQVTWAPAAQQASLYGQYQPFRLRAAGFNLARWKNGRIPRKVGDAPAFVSQSFSGSSGVSLVLQLRQVLRAGLRCHRPPRLLHSSRRRCNAQGRLRLREDVPARPREVLSRSNRVLTLRRILRCTAAKSAHLRNSYSVEGIAHASQPHRRSHRGSSQVLSMWCGHRQALPTVP